MKDTIIKQEKKKVELPFPKLMISAETGAIIFFYKTNEGMLMRQDTTSNHTEIKVGEIGKFWYMGNFEDFKGTITLEND